MLSSGVDHNKAEIIDHADGDHPIFAIIMACVWRFKSQTVED